MSVSRSVQFLSPEEILARSSAQSERLKFPATDSVFRDRALRLRQLAAGHAMRDYLVFAGDIADAQHVALNTERKLKLPTPEQLDAAAGQGQPPLTPACWPLGQQWQEELQVIVQNLLGNAKDGTPVHSALRKLEVMDAVQLNQQAERLLNGIMLGLDMAAAPLLGAALQVYWTRLVAQTRAAQTDHTAPAFSPVDDGKVCPCCGSQPVASVLRMGSEEGNSRYLHCALCQTEWHMVRVKCTHCESTKGIYYQELQGTSTSSPPTVAQPSGAVRAECCDACGHYLKIVAMDKDPHVEPVADDLASVALDLLVTETGKQRHGLNYLLLWGEPEEDEARTIATTGVS